MYVRNMKDLAAEPNGVISTSGVGLCFRFGPGDSHTIPSARRDSNLPLYFDEWMNEIDSSYLGNDQSIPREFISQKYARYLGIWKIWPRFAHLNLQDIEIQDVYFVRLTGVPLRGQFDS